MLLRSLPSNSYSTHSHDSKMDLETLGTNANETTSASGIALSAPSLRFLRFQPRRTNWNTVLPIAARKIESSGTKPLMSNHDSNVGPADENGVHADGRAIAAQSILAHPNARSTRLV